MASLSDFNGDKPAIQTTTNTMVRSCSTGTLYPPGAWIPADEEREQNPNGHIVGGESALVDIGEAVAGALGAASSVAAKYLPASVVKTFSAYAPSSRTANTDDSNAHAAPTMAPASVHPLPDTEVQPDVVTGSAAEHGDLEVGSAHTPAVLNAAAPLASLTTAAQVVSPSAVPPLSTPPQCNPGLSESISTTAVTSHDSLTSSSFRGTVAPPPSVSWDGPLLDKVTDSDPAATSITALVSHDSNSSVHGGTIASRLSTSTSSVWEGPLVSKLSEGFPTPPPPVNAKSGSGVPSSALSMKSGYVGSGPASVPNGVTPSASELEKEGLAYLVPHIHENEHGSSADPSKSRFTEDMDACPAPPDAMTPDTRSRRSSESKSSGSTKRRVSLVKRIKGEAKIIAGKIQKDEAKVSEGRAILDGDA